jgi:hypothetical protein
MQAIRQHLAAFIGVWLICQTTALVAAPASLCSGASASSAPEGCTCARDAAHECPMHHRTPARSNCSCRDTNDTTTAIIASLLGPIAVLASPIDGAAPIRATDSITWPAASTLEQPAALDSPPPRA